MQQPIKRPTRFSYSRLNQYKNCPFAYYLKYDQKHYLYTDSLAAEMGTLVHHIEETIACNIIDGVKVDYERLKKDFLDINVPKRSPSDPDGGIFGINILKKKYAEEFYDINDKGESYFTKAQDYLEKGIYRLETYLKENPNLKLIDVEKAFEVTYNGVVFFGYIDRILQDVNTGEYIIEDIKTKDKPFADSELATPLQFIVYSLALKEAFNLSDYPSTFYYDLPVVGIRQKAGTKGCINRGLKKITQLLESIANKEWAPKPSPLCFWCDFSNTNPKQLEGGKNLCCYYSLWTRQNKTNQNMAAWEGLENHEKVMARIKADNLTPDQVYLSFDDIDF